VVCRCLSVGHDSLACVGCTTAAEPIKMPFVMWTCGPKEPCIRRGPGRKEILGVILWHAHNCAQSVLSTLFASRQQRCGLWLTVYGNNLLLFLLQNYKKNYSTSRVQIMLEFSATLCTKDTGTGGPICNSSSSSSGLFVYACPMGLLAHAPMSS